LQCTSTERIQQSGLLSPALSSRGGEGASPNGVTVFEHLVEVIAVSFGSLAILPVRVWPCRDLGSESAAGRAARASDVSGRATI
jgi:hypothetical protein